MQSGKGQFGKEGSQDLGELLGLITGDGHFTNRGRGKEAVVVSLWGDDRALAERVAAYMNVLLAQANLNAARTYCVHPVAVPDRNMVFLRSVAVVRALAHYGFTAATKHQVPEVVWRGSEDCVRGYLRALFQTRRHRQCCRHGSQSCSVRLASSHRSLLQDVQQLLANFGVFCRIRRATSRDTAPDARWARAGNGLTRARPTSN